MREATGLQINSLISIANSTAGHVVLPDYMRTDIMEAASTIRDLDLAVDKLVEERDEALKKIDELEDVCGDSADRMLQLVKERDEARRMYCKAVADHYEYACNAELDGAGPYTQKDVAKDEGWDCFKEDGK